MRNANNQVQLIGRVGNEIELKETASGKKFINLSIATNEYYKDAKGEKVQNTTWHKVTAWNKPAELMYNLLNKGNEVLVQGKLSNRNYEDNEGNKQYITEILVDNFLKMEKKDKLVDLPF